MKPERLAEIRGWAENQNLTTVGGHPVAELLIEIERLQTKLAWAESYIAPKLWDAYQARLPEAEC